MADEWEVVERTPIAPRTGSKAPVDPWEVVGRSPIAPNDAMVEPGNIDLAKRPVVQNPDRTISTVDSMSFNDRGKEVLIPTIHPEGYRMSPQQSVNWYRQSGQHLGKFSTPQAATAYAEQLHQDQDKMYSPKAAGPQQREVGFGEAFGRGLKGGTASAFEKAGTATTLPISRLIQLGKNVLTGRSGDTDIVRAVKENLINPLAEASQEAAIQPTEKLTGPGVGGHIVGSLVPMAGEYALTRKVSPQQAAKVGATVAQNVRRIAGNELIPAVNVGASQMMQTKNQLIAQGATPEAAEAAAVASYPVNTVGLGLPLGMAGNVGKRALTGAGINVATDIPATMIENAVLRAYGEGKHAQDPFAAERLGTAGGIGGFMAALLGQRAPRAPGAEGAPGAPGGIPPAEPIPDWAMGRYWPILKANGITDPTDPRAHRAVQKLMEQEKRFAEQRPGSLDDLDRTQAQIEDIAAGVMHPNAATWGGRVAEPVPPVFAVNQAGEAIPATATGELRPDIAAGMANQETARQGNIAEAYRQAGLDPRLQLMGMIGGRDVQPTGPDVRTVRGALNPEQIALIQKHTGFSPEQIAGFTNSGQRRYLANAMLAEAESAQRPVIAADQTGGVTAALRPGETELPGMGLGRQHVADIKEAADTEARRVFDVAERQRQRKQEAQDEAAIQGKERNLAEARAGGTTTAEGTAALRPQTFAFFDATFEGKGKNRGQMTSGHRIEILERDLTMQDENGKDVPAMLVRFPDHPNKPEMPVPADRITELSRPANPRYAQDIAETIYGPPRGVGTGPQQPQPRRAGQRATTEPSPEYIPVGAGEKIVPEGGAPRAGEDVSDLAFERVEGKPEAPKPKELAGPVEAPKTPEALPHPPAGPTLEVSGEGVAGTRQQRQERLSKMNEAQREREEAAMTGVHPREPEAPKPDTEAPKTSADWKAKIEELGQNKPGTIKDVFGDKRPSPTQRAVHKAKEQKWHDEMSAAMKGYAGALISEGGKAPAKPAPAKAKAVPAKGAKPKEAPAKAAKETPQKKSEEQPKPEEPKPAEKGPNVGGGTLHMNPFGQAISWFFGNSKQWKDSFNNLKNSLSPGGKENPVKALIRLYAESHAADTRAIVRANGDSKTAQEVIDHFHNETGTGRATGEVFHDAVEARTNNRLVKLHNLLGDLLDDPDSMKQLSALIRSGRAQAGTKLGDAAIEIRKMLDAELKQLRNEGVELGEVKHGYFPREYMQERILKDSKGFIDAAAQAFREEGMSRKDAQEAANELHDAILFGQHGSIFKSQGGAAQAPFLKGRTFGRQVDNPAHPLNKYMNDDAGEVLANYFHRAAKRGEIAKRFGDSFSRWNDYKDANGKEQKGLQRKIREEGGGAALEKLQHFVATAAGIKSADTSKGGMQAASWLRTWGALSFLEKSVLSSLNEFITPAIRSGNMMDVGRSLVNTLSDVVRTTKGKDRRDMAEFLDLLSGHINGSLSSARFAGGDPTSRFQAKVLKNFFGRIGQTRWTDSTRVASVDIGRVFISRLAKDADGKLNTKFLGELGIPPEKVGEFKRWIESNGGMVPMGAIKGEMGDLYRVAVRKFVHQSIMSPSATSKPAWMNSTFGSVVGQLQSFNYAFYENFLKRNARLAKEGLTGKDYTNAERAKMLYPALMSPMLAAAAYAVGEGRDAVLGDPNRRKEETPQDKALKAVTRGLPVAPIDPWIQYATSAKYDSNFIKSFAGPTLGNLGTGIDAARDVMLKNSEGTNTQERKALKTVWDSMIEPTANMALSATPVAPFSILATQALGSGTAREKLFVEPLAGPKAEKKKKESEELAGW